ncbi:cysteine dioxygenase [Pseudomonas phage vB_PpuP-BotAed]
MIWNLIARLASTPCVANWLIRRAQKTPYTHIYHPKGLYMGRWWLFNPYPGPDTPHKNRFPISVRVHHICLPDDARDLHDHPWNARTIILKGGYLEQRLEGSEMKFYERKPGDTATIKFGEYHTIESLQEGGAWTLFITGKYRGTWGFLVNGIKINWRNYKGYDNE